MYGEEAAEGRELAEDFTQRRKVAKTQRLKDLAFTSLRSLRLCVKPFQRFRAHECLDRCQ